eukprot:gene4104-8466_t
MDHPRQTFSAALTIISLSALSVAIDHNIHQLHRFQPPTDCSFHSHYPYQYVAYQTKIPPIIDGSLEDSMWKETPWTRDFIDISGPDFPVPRFRTRAKIRWDENYLYVGGYLEEPQIWATLTKHDSIIFHDNDFEVFVCPDGTSHYYKEFEMNALNTTWSLCLNKPYLNGGYENSSRVFGKHGWDDPDLRCGVYIDGVLNDVNVVDNYWTVEIAFPLSALAYNTTSSLPPRPGQYWRINFSRVEWHVFKNGTHYSKVPRKPEDNWVLAPSYAVNIHMPEYWSYLQFADTNVNRTSVVPDPDWTVRFIAMQLYYAEETYGVYTSNIKDVVDLTPIPNVLTSRCTGTITIFVEKSGDKYHGHVPNVNGTRTAIIRDDRYLLVVDL